VRSIDRFLRVGSGADSSAGITALLAEVPVTQTLVDRFDCESAPESWHWDGVDFSLLRAGRTAASDAGGACLLKVSAGRSRILIPAQLDAAAEGELVEDRDLRADIVIIPRNGSDSASTQAFVQAVQPRWAVVSGRRAQGGEVRRAVSRWEQGGSQVLATADLGAIRFRLGAAGGVEGPEALRAGQRDGHSGGQRTLWRVPP
jgi:competence protein ComEC